MSNELNLMASSKAKPTTNTALSAALVFLIVSLSALPHPVSAAPPSSHPSSCPHHQQESLCPQPVVTVMFPSEPLAREKLLWAEYICSPCSPIPSSDFLHESFCCLCSFDVGCSCVVMRNWDDGEHDAENHTQHFSDVWSLKRETLITNCCVNVIKVEKVLKKDEGRNNSWKKDFFQCLLQRFVRTP